MLEMRSGAAIGGRTGKDKNTNGKKRSAHKHNGKFEASPATTTSRTVQKRGIWNFENLPQPVPCVGELETQFLVFSPSYVGLDSTAVAICRLR